MSWDSTFKVFTRSSKLILYVALNYPSVINLLTPHQAAHMSEEVRDASQAVPKAMIAVYIINFCLIFPAVLTVAYHIPVMEDALADPTLYPTIYVLRRAMSSAWLTVMLTIVRLRACPQPIPPSSPPTTR